MSGTLFVATLVGICSIVAYVFSLILARRSTTSRRFSMLAGGIAPTAIILVALIISHIIWLARHQGGYSPLVFVIYGFWLLGLNLSCNLAAARAAVRNR